MKEIWNDIRKGANLDIYLGVLITFLVAVLGFFKKFDLNMMFAALLGSVAIFIRRLLQSNKLHERSISSVEELLPMTKKLQEKLKYVNSDTSVTFKTTPPEIKTQMENSDEIFILGASLHSTAHNYYNSIQIALNKGAKVKIIACEPSDELSTIQIRRTYVNNNASVLSRKILDNLTFLESLETNRVADSKIELKTIDVPIAFGLIGLSTNDNKFIYVKLMAFNTPGHEYIHFSVSIKEQYELYQHFNQQFSRMWEYSKDFNSKEYE